MNVPCIKCKGKGLCGREFCPIHARAESIFKSIDLLSSKDFSSNSPPAVFVGRHNYPNVNVGILAPSQEKEDIDLYDAPHIWSKGFTIKDIIKFRSSLINSRFKQDVHKFGNRFLELSQELTMSAKAVDVEISLKKKPKQEFNFGNITLPMGPGATLKKIDLVDNPKPKLSVEKVFYDTDLKSVEALNYLYKKQIDTNTLSKLLSIGVMGVKKSRRLVPTRWSITATDDTLGKILIKQVKDFKELGEYYCFFGNLFGNYYLIFFFPGVWSYELFESYMPNTLYNPNQNLESATDYEFYKGRKKYADETVGGYYAARLSILEKLDNLKRQGSVLALRFVTNEYTCPLGVWVCRESVKKTLETFSKCDTEEEMLEQGRKLIKEKFGYDLNNLLNKSKLLKYLRTQSKLSRFF
jgi:hypothetical protein